MRLQRSPSRQGTGDIILRGAFDALPSGGTVTTSASPQYLWFGHLDAFWPFDSGAVDASGNPIFTYDFQQTCNIINGSPLLCYQIPTDGCGTTHCLDFASGLNTESRRIFTGLPNKDTSNGPGKGRVALYNFKDGTTASCMIDVTTGTSGAGGNLTSSTVLPDGSTTIGAWLQSQFSLGNPPSMLSTSVNADFNADGKVDVNDSEHPDQLDTRDRYPSYAALRSRTDTRSRTWVMGDVVYSTPVIVGIPTLGGVSGNDPDVASFWASRNATIDAMSVKPATISLDTVIKKVVYVGSNDGMLHAYVQGVWDWDNQRWCETRDTKGNDTIANLDGTFSSTYAQFLGVELWAYIPTNLLGSLQVLASSSYGNSCPHRTMIDLSPQPYYIKSNMIKTYANTAISGDTSGTWRTVIVGGERGGGDVHFAMDVTNPKNPILLWEFSHIRNMVQWTGSSSSTFTAGYRGEREVLLPCLHCRAFPAL